LSDALPDYVKERHAKISSLDLSSWLLDNRLPAICEPKYDGLRVFLFKSGEHLVVSGRVGSIYTPAVNPTVFAKVPELVRAPKRMILDGEYVSKDGLHFFDLLQIDDRDMRPLPLYRRKEMLHEVISDSGLESPVTWAETPEEIQKFAEETISKGSEGIVVKNPISFYGQTHSWTKIKRFDTADCFVIDFHNEGEGGIKKVWVLAVYDPEGKIVTLGEVSSFTERVDPKRVRLGSVVEVRFGPDGNGKFAAQFILRIRHDKLAIECTISQIPQLQKMVLP
jgi:ATP-dependent DNA ligase